MPHWDVGTGLSAGTRTRRTAFILELFDLALTAVLVYWFWKDTLGTTLIYHICIGAFCGLLPDFLEAPRNFLKWEPWFLKPVNQFHHNFHHSIPTMWLGLLPQIIIVGVIYFLK